MATPTNIILACDESGAKGYADQQESYPGEVGVFAGILVPEGLRPEAQSELHEIYRRYKPATGKLHIADLQPSQQQTLRRATYDTIKKLNLPCFWYAIHVAGLNDWYLTQKRLVDDARKRAQEINPNPRYKGGSPRDHPPSMHEELFAGLYAHIIAFLEERRRKRVSIEVRTDQIDSPIVTNFEKICNRLLDNYPKTHKVPGWDTQNKTTVETSVEFNVPDTSYIDLQIEVVDLTINPIPLGDGYTLAADVLANSLYYLFKHRDQSQLYNPLNEPNAIQNHPLAQNLAAFYDWGNGDIIEDRLYRHPIDCGGGGRAT